MVNLNNTNSPSYNKTITYEFNGVKITIDSKNVTIKQTEYSLISFSHEQVKTLLEILNKEFNSNMVSDIIYRDNNLHLNQFNKNSSGEYKPPCDYMTCSTAINHQDTEIRGTVEETN